MEQNSTNSKKNVYVLSSCHFIKDLSRKEVNDFKLKELLKIRLGLLEIIAHNTKCESYFMDSLASDIANLFNEYLDDAKDIDMNYGIRKSYSKGEWLVYDVFETLKVLAKLRKKGIGISFKTTEDSCAGNGEEKRAIAAYYRNKEDSDRMVKGVATGTIPMSEMRKYVKEKIIEYRDETIYQNILSHGGTENLLFIGSTHALKTLFNDSSLNVHRIKIQYDGDKEVYVATGTVKKDLEKEICSGLIKNKYPIDIKVNFLN